MSSLDTLRAFDLRGWVERLSARREQQHQELLAVQREIAALEPSLSVGQAVQRDATAAFVLATQGQPADGSRLADPLGGQRLQYAPAGERAWQALQTANERVAPLATRMAVLDGRATDLSRTLALLDHQLAEWQAELAELERAAEPAVPAEHRDAAVRLRTRLGSLTSR